MSVVFCEEMGFNKIKLDDAIRRLLNDTKLPFYRRVIRGIASGNAVSKKRVRMRLPGSYLGKSWKLFRGSFYPVKLDSNCHCYSSVSRVRSHE